MEKLYKPICFLGVIFSLEDISSFAQWNQLNIGTTEDLYSAQIVSSNDIYIGAKTSVLKTTDGGGTWSGIPVVDNLNNSLAPSYVYDLHFFSTASGLACGIYFTGNNELVLQTTNSATNWAIVNNYNGGMPLRYIQSFDFFNASTGCGVGSNGRLLRTTNAGSSWASVNSNTSNTLHEVDFYDSNTGFIAADQLLFKTSNGGLTWSSQTVSKELLSISCPTSSIVYACSDNSIFKTIDGGNTWSEILTPFQGINTLLALNQDTVLIGTWNGIYITKNGGQYFEFYKGTKLKPISKFEISGSLIYAVGQNGTVLRTNNLWSAPPYPISIFNDSISVQCTTNILYCQNQGPVSYSYQWLINNTPYSTSYNCSQTYTATTTNQTVSLISFNGSNYDTLTKTFNTTVYSPVTANAGNDVLLCYGNSVQLQGSGGTSCTWSPSYGLNLTTIYNPVAQPFTTTTYTFSVLGQGNCTDTDTITIAVNPTIQPDYWYQSLPNTQSIVADIDFVNANTGFGVAANSGEFVKTTDGGITWATTVLPGNTWTGAVDFIDTNIGYVASDYLFKTTDGGNSFTPIGSATDIIFLNKDTGLIIDDWPGYNIKKTTNGGQTFSGVYNYNTLYDIKYADKNVCYAVGGMWLSQTGGVLKSTDGGNTWVQLSSPLFSGTGMFNGVDCLNNDTVYVVATNGYVFKTTDGGTNWNRTYSGGSVCIDMVNDTLGYIGGMGGSIFKTINGGECWQDMGIVNGNGGTINDVCFLSPFIGYASGEKTNFGNGIVYRTTKYRFLFFTIDSVLCSNSNYSPVNSSTGYQSYQWYINNILYSTSRDTSLVFTLPGNYSIKLVADSSGTKDSLLTNIIVISSGINNLIYSDSCFGIPIWFYPNAAICPVQNWLWNFGDTASGFANIDSTQNPSHIFNSTGNYTVTLIVNGMDTIIKTVTIFSNTVTDFSFSDSCTGSQIWFDPNSTTCTGQSWLWNFGDTASGPANIDTTLYPSHVYTAPGNYVIMLIVDGIDTMIKTLTISDNTVTDFTYSVPCTWDNIGFSPVFSGCPGQSWLWNFGDTASGFANIDSSQYPSHIFNSAGNYIVTLIVDGVDTIIKTLTIGAYVTLGNDTVITPGDTIILDAGIGNDYYWSTGGITQTIFVTDTGTYYVDVYDINWCWGVDTIKIYFYSDLQTNGWINPSSPTCGSSSTMLNLVIQNNNNYSLNNFPIVAQMSGTVSSTVTVTYPGTLAAMSSDTIAIGPFNTSLGGIYTFMGYTNAFYDSSNANDTSYIILNFLNAPPTSITANNPVIFCQGDSVMLTANSATGYLWSTGETTQAINVSLSGNYFVTITDANGCTGSAPQTVTVYPLPTVGAGQDVTICMNDSTYLYASGGTNYMWTPSSSLSNPNVSDPVAGPTSSTTYIVIVTDVNGCSNSDSVAVTVGFSPVANAGTDVTICMNATTTLSASGGGYYEWNPWNGLSDPYVSNPVASPFTSTSYTVVVYDANFCFSDTDSVNVFVNPIPSVTLVLNPDTICIFISPFALSGGSPSGGNYSGTGVSAGNFDPGIAGSGLHDISYTYSDLNNCTDSAIAQIYVDICTGMQNVFSNGTILIFPNPSNGLIAIQSTAKISTIEIINILGEKVYLMSDVGRKTTNAQASVIRHQPSVINLSSQPSGIYFLRVKSEEGSATQKIILLR